MALITISTTDLDGVTIKKVETEEGTIKVGAPGAEINVLDAQPEDTDEYYYTNESKYLQHVATEAVWQAQVMTKHQRAEPVNEQLEQAFEYVVATTNDSVNFSINSGIYIKSLVDGYNVSASDVSGDTSVTVQKSDYANAKALNEAYASKHGTVITAKRYATSEGYPVVKETEFSVTYPALPWYENELTLGLSISDVTGNFAFNIRDAGLPESVEQVFRSDEFNNTQVEVEYTIDKGDGNPVTGTATTTVSQAAKNFLSDIGHAYSGKQWTVTYKVKPFNFAWFNGNVTIVTDAVTGTVNESL